MESNVKDEKLKVVAYKSDYGKIEVITFYVFFIIIVLTFLPLLNISISAFIWATVVLSVLLLPAAIYCQIHQHKIPFEMIYVDDEYNLYSYNFSIIISIFDFTSFVNHTGSRFPGLIGPPSYGILIMTTKYGDVYKFHYVRDIKEVIAKLYEIKYKGEGELGLTRNSWNHPPSN